MGNRKNGSWRWLAGRCVQAVLLTGFWSAPLTAATVYDNFDRPDNSVIGSGWTENEWRGTIDIKSNRLASTPTVNSHENYATIYQDQGSGPAYRFTADITEGKPGNDNNTRRYAHSFFINGDGTYDTVTIDTGTAHPRAYGVMVIRQSSAFNNSRVVLFDNGTVIATVFSPYQFTDTLHVTIRIFQNRSVTGTITSGSAVFSFVFPARIIIATGNKMGVGISWMMDVSPAATIDNLTILSGTNTAIGTGGDAGSGSKSKAVAYPNPFNLSISSTVHLRTQPVTEARRVRICTMRGEVVRDFGEDEIGSDGIVDWDGRTANGVKVASGTYLLIITNSSGGESVGHFTLVK